MKKLFVNVNMAVNKEMIRRETRNGAEFIVINSATLPDNVVMNGGMYPADEIEAGFKSLEGTLAPLGHPVDADGNLLSATNADAIDNFYVGARNENVRRENGRVWMDKAINVQVARKSDKGQRLLDRIEAVESGAGAPIHTSTGLLLSREEKEGVANGKGYKWIARNMQFDHDAILLDEPGAATPDDGVGMAVNAAGEQVEVINMTLEPVEVEIKAKALEPEGEEQSEAISLLKRLMSMLGFAQSPDTAYNSDSEYSQTQEVDPMKEQIVERLKAANAYKDGMSGADALAAYDKLKAEEGHRDTEANTDTAAITAAVNAAVAPLIEKVEAMESAANAQAEAEKAQHVETVVNAGLLDQEDAEKLDAGVLAKMAANCAAPAGTATRLNPALNANGAQDKLEDYLPE